jgi:PAS domain S-box-containing protein
MAIDEFTQSALADLLFDEPIAGRCLVAPDGRVLRANAAWLRSTGLSVAQVLGANILDLLADARDVALAMHERARAGERVEVPRHARQVQGRETWWDGSIAPIPMDGGVGLLITAREVGPPAEEGDQSTEERLRKSIARTNAIVNNVTDNLVLIEAQRGIGGEILDWRCVHANDRAAGLLGMTREQLIGRTVREVLGARAAAAEERLNRVLAAGAAERYETELGEQRLLATIFPVDANTVGSATLDITDRKRSEHALRESEARYRTLFDSIDEGFCIIEVLFDEAGKPTDYRFVEVNEAFERQTGLVGATGRRIRELAPSHEEHWFEIYGRIALTGEAIRFENSARALGRWYDVYAFRVGAPAQRRVAILFNDVMERHRAEVALRQSEATLDAFFASSTGILNLQDDQLRYLKTDPLTPTYFGLTRETIVGRSMEDLAPEFTEKYGAMMRRVIATGQPELNIEVQSPVPTRQGEVTWWRSSYFPVPITGGKCGIGVMGIEITDLKKAEAALHEADHRKDEFLGMLSHELRNPLAPIRNSIHILRHASAGAELVARAHSAIERQTEHLTRLVDDLLDITRVSRGKIALQRTRLDLREVVRKTTDDLSSMYASAGVELHVEYRTAGPVWIDADPTRMAQVLGNLLQNSLKFTHSGGAVDVTLDRCRERAELCVRDNGVGMEPTTVERMFEPFVQADQALARTKGGLGLGLALVKGIVEMHGGSVQARSEGLGRGAEFVVSIPLLEGVETPEQERVARAKSGAQRILVIEDNVDSGQSLADILELDGHRVRVAHDGRSGLALAREFKPDVILCDIGLPGLDGYEIAREIRRDDALRSVRLIGLSGYARPGDRQRASAAGFDAHIAKPPDVNELMAVIAKS